MIRNAVIASAVLCACLATAPPAGGAAGPSDGWQRVGSGVLGGVSGMAAAEGAPVGHGLADAVVVRDSTGARESRVATVRLRPGRDPVVGELPWSGTLPAGLEALDAVPGRPGHCIAVASGGDAFHIVVANGRATLQAGPVALPGRRDGDDYESFALHRDRSGRTFAVWATRGSGDRPAVVHASSVRIGAYGPDFGTVSARQEFAVPFPDRGDVRQISDLKILPDGTVMVSSASGTDAGDGPFASAVHDAGRLTVNAAHDAVLRLKPKPELTPLNVFTERDNRKIEAIAFLPGRHAIWGTDDENNGGCVKFDRVGR
ncbi:hypothetical protein [Streptomyces sp. NBC_01285]|uniref:hypothetical protein n=1 Tax=Streptomyces sp. NBC_01285 TaxID=2903813 RepID=UPI002254B381|nr:hypothetical protein [Streptomyces sp. NBC_01285]MCX4768719.1 hypothetical protein [Streptomyces sp. NBC_01285]